MTKKWFFFTFSHTYWVFEPITLHIGFGPWTELIKLSKSQKKSDFWKFYRCSQGPKPQKPYLRLKNSLSVKKCEKKVIFWSFILCEESTIIGQKWVFSFRLWFYNVIVEQKSHFFFVVFVVFYVLIALEFLHTWRFLIKYIKSAFPKTVVRGGLVLN